jgi:hypothetical protein
MEEGMRVDTIRTLAYFFSISCGVIKIKLSKSRFMLNVSHLKQPMCILSINGIWNFMPLPKGPRGWIIWWEDAINGVTTFF